MHSIYFCFLRCVWKIEWQYCINKFIKIYNFCIQNKILASKNFLTGQMKLLAFPFWTKTIFILIQNLEERLVRILDIIPYLFLNVRFTRIIFSILSSLVFVFARCCKFNRLRYPTRGLNSERVNTQNTGIGITSVLFLIYWNIYNYLQYS